MVRRDADLKRAVTPPVLREAPGVRGAAAAGGKHRIEQRKLLREYEATADGNVTAQYSMNLRPEPAANSELAALVRGIRPADRQSALPADRITAGHRTVNFCAERHRYTATHGGPDPNFERWCRVRPEFAAGRVAQLQQSTVQEGLVHSVRNRSSRK
jgi:hypothetical protein